MEWVECIKIVLDRYMTFWNEKHKFAITQINHWLVKILTISHNMIDRKWKTKSSVVSLKYDVYFALQHNQAVILDYKYMQRTYLRWKRTQKALFLLEYIFVYNWGSVSVVILKFFDELQCEKSWIFVFVKGNQLISMKSPKSTLSLFK